MFTKGQIVRRKSDGREGVVEDITESEIVVRFAATGETKNSPWGEYADAGETGHIFKNFASRVLEAK